MIDQGFNDESDPWFRLILLCRPFKISRDLLKRCARIVIEPPTSMKQKIIADIDNMKKQEQMTLSIPNTKERFTPQYRRLVTSLAILHSVLEKRNAFGNRGWANFVSITKGEIETSSGTIRYFLNFFNDPTSSYKTSNIPWPEMQTIISEICLGGQLTENYDTNLLFPIVAKYLNKEAEEGDYKFGENSVYGIPKYDTFDELLHHVELLPDCEDFALYGMDEETSLEVQYNELNAELRQLQLMESQETIEKNECEIKGDRVESIIDKLIIDTSKLSINKTIINKAIMTQIKGSLYGHNIYLLEEINRYKSLITLITTTLNEIKYYITSGQLMPPSLERIYFVLDSESVPEEFLGYSWNHPLAEWFNTLKQCVEYIKTWAPAELCCLIKAILF